MKKKVNKSELIERITKESPSLKNADVKEGIDSLVDFLTYSLVVRNRIEVRGFGSFSCRKRQSRLARNPRDGTAIAVGSKFHPYFRPSKLLRQELNS
tara:strand:+ start:279 stop:569 length:291 start_codon:yes stop_codon:yes gene_type:complete